MPRLVPLSLLAFPTDEWFYKKFVEMNFTVHTSYQSRSLDPGSLHTDHSSICLKLRLNGMIHTNLNPPGLFAFDILGQ